VADGKIGFIGGAGIASHWIGGDKGKPPWRDMMCRVRGELVIGLQSCFAENWLETTGQILDVSREFPDCGCDEPEATQKVQGDDSRPARGMVVISTPSAARSSRARVLFQVLMASARKTVYINSPYFLPDRAARWQMIQSVRERGVRVVVIAPNNYNNHYIARTASRRVYGQLIQGGVEIHEYQPSMIHKKAMVVDGQWSVIGSTNFDHRSFGLNDEVNLAAYDPGLAQSLERDFHNELSQSQQITYEAWRRRPLHEKLFSFIGLLLQRQS
jgi:cardiolipin synthase